MSQTEIRKATSLELRCRLQVIDGSSIERQAAEAEAIKAEMDRRYGKEWRAI